MSKKKQIKKLKKRLGYAWDEMVRQNQQLRSLEQQVKGLEFRTPYVGEKPIRPGSFLKDYPGKTVRIGVDRDMEDILKDGQIYYGVDLAIPPIKSDMETAVGYAAKVYGETRVPSNEVIEGPDVSNLTGSLAVTDSPSQESICEAGAGQTSYENSGQLNGIVDTAQVVFANGCGAGSRHVMLSGERGTGKTRALCMAAMRLAMTGMRVLLVAKTLDSSRYQKWVLEGLDYGPKVSFKPGQNMVRVGEGCITLFHASAVATLHGLMGDAAIVDDADSLSLKELLDVWEALDRYLIGGPKVRVLGVCDAFGLRDAGLLEELQVSGFETTVFNTVVTVKVYGADGCSPLLRELLAKKSEAPVSFEGHVFSWGQVDAALARLGQGVAEMARRAGASWGACQDLKLWLRARLGGLTEKGLRSAGVAAMKDALRAEFGDGPIRIPFMERVQGSVLADKVRSDSDGSNLTGSLAVTDSPSQESICDLDAPVPVVEVEARILPGEEFHVGIPIGQVACVDPEKVSLVDRKVELPSLGEPTRYEWMGLDVNEKLGQVCRGENKRLAQWAFEALQRYIAKHGRSHFYPEQRLSVHLVGGVGCVYENGLKVEL